MTEQEFWFKYPIWMSYFMAGKVVGITKDIDLAYQEVKIDGNDDAQTHFFFLKNKGYKYMTVINTAYPKHKQPANIVYQQNRICHELYKAYKQYVTEIENGTAPTDEHNLTLLEVSSGETFQDRLKSSIKMANKFYAEHPCDEPDQINFGINVKLGVGKWHSM